MPGVFTPTLKSMIRKESMCVRKQIKLIGFESKESNHLQGVLKGIYRFLLCNKALAMGFGGS